MMNKNNNAMKRFNHDIPIKIITNNHLCSLQYVCHHSLSLFRGVNSKLIKNASTGTQLTLIKNLFVMINIILTLSLWTRFYSEIVLLGHL